MGHLASNFSLSHRKGVATWWKDSTAVHLIAMTFQIDDHISSNMEEDPSHVEVVPLIVDVASPNPLVTFGGAPFDLKATSLVALILQQWFASSELVVRYCCK